MPTTCEAARAAAAVKGSWSSCPGEGICMRCVPCSIGAGKGKDSLGIQDGPDIGAVVGVIIWGLTSCRRGARLQGRAPPCREGRAAGVVGGKGLPAGATWVRGVIP
eukprot:1144585-Pelagomonas_calceolata.AAC.4